MRYFVKISYPTGGGQSELSFEKKDVSFGELKQSFLKRFGNLVEKASNSAAKEYVLVRYITFKAETIEEWVDEINSETRWELRVINDHGNGFNTIFN